MRTYLIRRLLLFVPVLLGVTLLVFVLMRVIPGDVAMSILNPDGNSDVAPAKYEQLRQELGLDRPLYVQYASWVAGVVRGDWGKSLRTQDSVLDEIRSRLPLTAEITLLTVLAAALIGIPLGVMMAIRQDSPLDYLLRLLSIGGVAMPNFWLGTLMLLAMVVFFHWRPPPGYASVWDSLWTNLKQVLWPCLALGYLQSAIIARMTRSALLEVLRQDYVRTAWAKGLRERTVILRHSLRNAILPVATLIGLQFTALMGGTVIMENLWNLPGIGRSLLDAISFRDYPMIQGLVLLFALFALVGNLFIDFAYAWLDPRVRYGDS